MGESANVTARETSLGDWHCERYMKVVVVVSVEDGRSQAFPLTG